MLLVLLMDASTWRHDFCLYESSVNIPQIITSVCYSNVCLFIHFSLFFKNNTIFCLHFTFLANFTSKNSSPLSKFAIQLCSIYSRLSNHKNTQDLMCKACDKWVIAVMEGIPKTLYQASIWHAFLLYNQIKSVLRNIKTLCVQVVSLSVCSLYALAYKRNQNK